MSLHPITAMFALLVSPFALAGAPGQAGAACPGLPDHPGLTCVSTPEGWFYAGDSAAAAGIAADVAQAARDFEHHFGRPALRGAVVATGSQGALDAAHLDLLANAGARWVLPWLDGRERREIQRAAIERALRGKMPDADDAVIGAMLEQAMLAAAKGSGDSTDRDALRHEVGHKLLIRAFWPDDQDQGADRPGKRYGGPGPDWLDEAAALLMEGPSMTARRMDLLATEDASRLLPLPDFLAAPHPMLDVAIVAAARTAAGDGAGITISSGDEAARIARDAAWFYAQARAFAAFMIDTSGQPDVFGGIAAHIAAGGDMEGWLSGHGAAHGLPDNMVALTLAWEEWLAGRR